MHVNISNMYKWDYNHTQLQMFDTRSKTIQHINIYNNIGFESNKCLHLNFKKNITSLIKQKSYKYNVVAYLAIGQHIILIY